MLLEILKIETYKTSQILLVLAVIILFIPIFLTLPALKTSFVLKPDRRDFYLPLKSIPMTEFNKSNYV